MSNSRRATLAAEFARAMLLSPDPPPTKDIVPTAWCMADLFFREMERRSSPEPDPYSRGH